MIMIERIRALYNAGALPQARTGIEPMLEESRSAEALYLAACIHDSASLETEAVAFYCEAIEAGLADEDLRGAYLGLGSTYRALGCYREALDVFNAAVARFPEASELRTFRAMTLYNMGDYEVAMREVLQVLSATTADPALLAYRRALDAYALDLGATHGQPA